MVWQLFFRLFFISKFFFAMGQLSTQQRISVVKTYRQNHSRQLHSDGTCNEYGNVMQLHSKFVLTKLYGRLKRNRLCLKLQRFSCVPKISFSFKTSWRYRSMITHYSCGRPFRNRWNSMTMFDIAFFAFIFCTLCACGDRNLGYLYEAHGRPSVTILKC